jgi:hypothetical protein
MLSTPGKRFAWARSERFSEFTFFSTLVKRRRRPPPKRIAVKSTAATGKWKPAPWTPWLWVK